MLMVTDSLLYCSIYPSDFCSYEGFDSYLIFVGGRIFRWHQIAENNSCGEPQLVAEGRIFRWHQIVLCWRQYVTHGFFAISFFLLVITDMQTIWVGCFLYFA